MREFDLPSPNIGATGFHLRRVAAKAISYIQINKRADGTHPEAAVLRNFFKDCSDRLAVFDATPESAE